MQTTSNTSAALVLGGGGPLGIAWEAAMLQGWSSTWTHFVTDTVPLTAFLDGRIIGTSAGAIVGAHLVMHDSASALFAEQSQPLGPDAPARPSMTRFMAAFFKAKLFTRDVTKLRRSMGRSAARAALPGETEYLAAFARSYVSPRPWRTDRELLVTAVNAESGEFHAWGAASGIPLPIAVAASCAVPCVFPLVHHGGQTYMDGGIGSSTNADLAAGCARVVVLDPLGRMLGASAPLENERRILEASSSHTLAFTPDDAVTKAIGNHVMDPSRRAEVARLGHAQGVATAAGVWSFLHSGTA